MGLKIKEGQNGFQILLQSKESEKKWKNTKTHPGDEKNVEHEGMSRPRTCYRT